MGDPRHIGKKYVPPNHPWIRARIEESKVLAKEYGFKNRKEIWKMESILKSFTRQAKKLAIVRGKPEQVEKERKQVIARVQKYGLISQNAQLGDILGLTTKDIMNRRLQSIIVKKGLARTVKQSRQMITHGHIIIKGIPMTSPSYLVPIIEESMIAFKTTSGFANPEHPERTVVPKKKPVEKREERRFDGSRRREQRRERPRGRPVQQNIIIEEVDE
ncbi:30S ribosomal protein S4 [Candidatus Woesearchaeota archaeon]|nr:30S ribosomal protein S4 [Candidatus Woesearchaeota archaeon]